MTVTGNALSAAENAADCWQDAGVTFAAALRFDIPPSRSFILTESVSQMERYMRS